MVHFGTDANGAERKHSWNYATAAGMLRYLASNSRHDIAFAVHQLTRLTNNPKASHDDILLICRYLQGTMDAVYASGSYDVHGQKFHLRHTSHMACFIVGDQAYQGMQLSVRCSRTDAARKHKGNMKCCGRPTRDINPTPLHIFLFKGCLKCARILLSAEDVGQRDLREAPAAPQMFPSGLHESQDVLLVPLSRNCQIEKELHRSASSYISY